MATATRQQEGVILRVNSRGFGYIGIVGHPDLWFHFNFCRDFEDDLGERMTGQRVLCSIQHGPRGPVAENVRPAD